MNERHYDDESLIALMEAHGAPSDPHLPGCTQCGSRYQSFQSLAGILTSVETWDVRELPDAPVTSTIANLRAFATRMETEAVSASALVDRLLAGPREMWMQTLEKHPDCRTAGVVRRLLEYAYDAVVTMPPDAVELTAMATDIADHLDPAGHEEGVVPRLRGAAWRDRAYALYYTSRYAEALAACDLADAAFAQCVVDEWDRARVGIVRTLVLRAYERLDEAQSVARRSALSFEQFEDLDRIASATIVQVNILFSRARYADAWPVLLALESRLRDTSLEETHARVLGNLGHCAFRLGRLDVALGYLERSAAIHETMGVTTEFLRLQWNIAELLVQTGRFAAAEERLLANMSRMEHLGMVCEAATQALDLAELLVVNERYAEVEVICLSAMRSFERAGLGYSPRALTALAFIREAAALRTANKVLVHSVREYIHRLPSQPNLLFAPPPPADAEKFFR